MTKLYQRYVGFLYLKNFAIIFLALEFFYVGIDLITNLKDLPSSANLQLLYMLFNGMTAVNYALPLSLVFAMIVTKFAMIRSNELICMYSVWVSKSQLIFPLFVAAILLTAFYIALNMTSFTYAYEYRSNLLKYNRIASISSDLFLKFEGKYVYFKELDPIKQEAKEIKIFSTNGTELQEIIAAKRGIFFDDNWRLFDVTVTQKPTVTLLSDKGLSIAYYKELVTLKGFRPKIIENVHQGKVTLSIPDALDAIGFFATQGVNINGIKANLYTLILFPLFAPIMVVILFYYLPASGRFFNLALLSFGFVFITLSVWGLLFVLGKLASNSVFLPEIGIALPILVLAFIAFFLYRKHR